MKSMQHLLKPKKPRTLTVCVCNAHGQKLYEGPLLSMPYPEDVILALSLRYFNDPTPCFIHRGAVLARMVLEIENALHEGNFNLSMTPFRDYFRALEGAAQISWTET